MVITIDLSKSDLDRIHDTLGIDSYDDIHAAFIEAIDIMLEKEEEFNKENDEENLWGKVINMKTTDLFNFFHDELKEVIEDTDWMNKFCEISGVFKEDAKECYWRNKEIKNDNEINNKLTDYIISLGYEMKLREYIKRNDVSKEGENKRWRIKKLQKNYMKMRI